MGKRDGYELVAEDDPDWLRFWSAFPKRVAKKEARKAWAELRPTSATVDKMVMTLSWQVTSREWLKDGGQFIPYPASWLRAARWEDEQPTLPQRVMSDAAASVLDVLGVKL